MSILNMIFAGLAGMLTLLAIVVTVLEYTSKGKHINKRNR